MDAFHYEGEGDIAYRLLVRSYLNGNDDKLDSSQYELVEYFKGKYPPSDSKFISKEKADSIALRRKISLH